MNFASLIGSGCGGKPKPVQLAPLPDDPKPSAEPVAAQPKPPQDDPPPPEEEEEEAPLPPSGPVEVKVPALQVAVKLVSKGTGKLAPLRYTAKAGGKQQVELVLEFSS